MAKDYYNILGVNKNASEKDIKKAYRNLAKELHPDVNKSEGAEAAFGEINEAYMVLINPKKRKSYDEGLDVKAPKLTKEQILELIKRQQEAMSKDFKFHSSNIYPPTDYKANQKGATIINIITLIFALSFVLDYFTYGPSEQYEVQSIVQKELLSRNLEDVGNFVLFTENGLYELDTAHINKVRQTIKTVEVKKSLFYQNPSIRLSENLDYVKNYGFASITYIFVLIVFLTSGISLLPQLSAERKFNAAIISSFFSIIAIVLMLIT